MLASFRFTSPYKDEVFTSPSKNETAVHGHDLSLSVRIMQMSSKANCFT